MLAAYHSEVTRCGIRARSRICRAIRGGLPALFRAAVAWNTLRLGEVVASLRAEGHVHINLFGQYRFEPQPNAFSRSIAATSSGAFIISLR